MAIYEELADRVVVVTGGGSGIGEGCALAFAEQGAWVWVWDRDAGAANRVASAIERAGGRASAYCCDVRDWDAVSEATETMLTKSRQLDVCVCNAGIGWDKSVALTEPSEWQTVIDINLTGAYNTSRSAFLAMKSRGSGAIVFIGSPHAYRTIPEASAYAASKGGMSALMRALAVEAAPHNIRVNAVLPGAVDTPALRAEAAWAGEDPEAVIARWKRIGDGRPLPRIGEPRDIADAVLYLSSDASGYVVGSELFVDGGLFAASALTSEGARTRSELPSESG